MGAKTVRDGLHDHIAVLERPEGSRTKPENRQEERRYQVAYDHEGADGRPRVHQAYGGEGPRSCNARHGETAQGLVHRLRQGLYRLQGVREVHQAPHYVRHQDEEEPDLQSPRKMLREGCVRCQGPSRRHHRVQETAEEREGTSSQVEAGRVRGSAYPQALAAAYEQHGTERLRSRRDLQAQMADRVALQAAEAELPPALLLRRKRQRDRDANLGRDDCKLVGKTGQGASESHVELFESSLATPSLAWILLRPCSVPRKSRTGCCKLFCRGPFTTRPAPAKSCLGDPQNAKAPLSVEIGAYSAYCVYVGTFTGQQ